MAVNQAVQFHSFLDYMGRGHVVPAGGIIVPQRVYTSPQIFTAHSSIVFYDGGYFGISLSKAYVEDFGGMQDRATTPALTLTNAVRIAIRIEWPGYPSWSQNINVVDRTRAANPITKGKLANTIARAVRSFFEDNVNAGTDGSAPGWVLRNIRYDNLYLLEFRHVSVGSWQAVFYYRPPHLRVPIFVAHIHSPSLSLPLPTELTPQFFASFYASIYMYYILLDLYVSITRTNMASGARALSFTTLIYTGTAIFIPLLSVLLLLHFKRRSPEKVALSHHAYPSSAFIIQNQVAHARLLPKEASHGFTYPVLFFMVSLNALESHSLDCGRGWLFGYGGVSFRVTGLRPTAYLHAQGCAALSIKEKLRKLLEDRGHIQAEHDLHDAWMLTMPSYLGYEGINPLTVFFCYRTRAQYPWAIVLEVHNTFEERHVYVLQIGVMEDEVPAKGFQHQWTFPRAFHVSPFNDRAGSYVVSVTVPPYNPSQVPEGCDVTTADTLHPRVRVHLLTSASTVAEQSREVKLSALMRPTTVTPLTSAHLIGALIQHPIILFLSLPRILLQAWILHYRKRLPVYPRPEPYPSTLSKDAAEGPQFISSGGIGWQSETALQRFARRRLHTFLQKRVDEVRVNVVLVSGNPLVHRSQFTYSDSQSDKSIQTLTISYLSSAFFTLMLEAPSARHAFLFGTASRLFTPSAEGLFFLVFAHHQSSPFSGARSGGVSIAQRLRLSLLPARLRRHPRLSVSPDHIIDSRTLSLQYLATLACLLASLIASTLERTLYSIFRVRFVPGQEPWRQWEVVEESIRAPL
ncbi:hypothetical protein NM688_g3507 [Phlebia brevispora]|uniref:Uncharacterized protein n=1 Tax=Phlebia brevispora TaxID=194682 RepID=A0ACC1T5Y7_9APHY|nr:hypothetical protein NM688_g3507 [Phlebia brevispora]